MAIEPGYDTEMTEDGLLVKGVRATQTISAEDLADMALSAPDGVGIDEAFLQSAVANFPKFKAEGFVHSITDNHDGTKIGRMKDQRLVDFEGKPTVEMDFIITNPDAQARFNRGELTELSIDATVEPPHIYATSLLSRGRGVFSFEELGSHVIPKSLVSKLGTSSDAKTIRLSRRIEFKNSTIEDEVEMNKDEILKLVKDEVGTSIKDAIQEALKASKIEEETKDTPDKIKMLLKKKDEEHAIALASVQAENDIKQMVKEAMDAGVPKNATAYKLLLEDCDTAKERNAVHNMWLASAKSGVSVLEDEDQPTSDLKLRKEYREEASLWQAAGFKTEDEFIKVRKTKVGKFSTAR